MGSAPAAGPRLSASIHPGRKDVAVVVPLSTSPELSPDEQISLRHLEVHLGAYDLFALAPKGTDVRLPGATTKYLPRRYFGSGLAHSRLLLTPEFYELFTGYRYILLYHLDALVFSDQLLEWCEAGVDYIGAPWVRCAEFPSLDNPRVGNGGFSLRSVDGALRVLRSRKLWKVPADYWRELHAYRPAPQRAVGRVKTLLKHLPVFNGVQHQIRVEMRSGGINDDVFFSDMARHYDPSFRVATLAEGLRFAWEYDPWQCAEMAGGQMPFGAHAWFKRSNRPFWQPHLIL
jgi:hypothetical protein